MGLNSREVLIQVVLTLSRSILQQHTKIYKSKNCFALSKVFLRFFVAVFLKANPAVVKKAHVP